MTLWVEIKKAWGSHFADIIKIIIIFLLKQPLKTRKVKRVS